MGFTTPDIPSKRFPEIRRSWRTWKKILDWADSESRIGGISVDLPFACPLELHAQYGNNDIKAALGMATFQTAGQTGVGLLHSSNLKAYAVLITFQKTETRILSDYHVRRLSDKPRPVTLGIPSNTAQEHDTGQNLIKHDVAATRF